MKTRIDERLRTEAQRFRFQFSCEHCAHFDDQKEACAEGYPITEHRSSRLDRSEMIFCKLFEGA